MVAHRVAAGAKERRTGVAEGGVLSNFKDKPLVNLLRINAVIKNRVVLYQNFSRSGAIADAAFILNPYADVDVVTDAVTVAIAFTTTSALSEYVDVRAMLGRVGSVVASINIRTVVNAVPNAI